MGNNQSKEHKPEQYSDKGMRKIGVCLDLEIPLGGPFFIKGSYLSNGSYKFEIIHHYSGFWTTFFEFESPQILSTDFEVKYDEGSIVHFLFKTDSIQRKSRFTIKFSFDFSRSFEDKNNFLSSLKLMPLFIQEITHLFGKYWYHVNLVNGSYVFYIVESSDETAFGLKSIIRSGDNVIKEMIVKSSNVPYIIEDGKENFKITSEDEGFVPIPIPIPIQLPTLAQPSSQQTFP